ncbi:dihydrofolate reductase family protein [Georgenia sp. SUBG003]|uniref:dihydrofolate reductase family protein n=1 Tax=Georgenia sp. SUBG003 TaxID=1497974 RepID=UPI003AB883E8
MAPPSTSSTPPPAEALATARAAADGQDVRIGGGPTVVREFLAAGLVDHMHLVQVPIVLGRGVRLWDGLEGLEDAYDLEAVSSPQRRHSPHLHT